MTTTVKVRKRKRRVIDMPVPEAGRHLIKLYGDRAQLVASNRYDAAETESTATFYEHVQAWIYKHRMEGGEG